MLPQASPLADAVALLARGDTQAPRLIFATVSSIQDDGSVNVNYLGSLKDGVPRLSSYMSPVEGDSVALLVIEGSFLVLGRTGGPGSKVISIPSQHEIMEPYSQMSWEGFGRSSDSLAQGKQFADSVSRSGAWYYGGDIAAYTKTAVPSSMQIYLARSKNDGGPDQVRPQLKLHNWNDPPNSGAFTGYETFAVPQPLEPGQGAWVSLPSAWITLLGRGTRRGVGLESSLTEEYMVMDDNSGSLAIQM